MYHVVSKATVVAMETRICFLKSIICHWLICFNVGHNLCCLVDSQCINFILCSLTFRFHASRSCYMRINCKANSTGTECYDLNLAGAVPSCKS